MANLETPSEQLRSIGFAALLALAACQSPGGGAVGGTTTQQGTAGMRDTATTSSPVTGIKKVGRMSDQTSNVVTAHLDGVELRAVIRTVKERVSIDLTIKNGGSANVYLTDVVLDAKTNGLQTDVLRAHHEAPNTAVLAARLYPPDPRTRYAHPPQAYTTKVAPGEVYKTTLSAAAPLRAADARGQEPDVECSRVRFDLGVIPESADLDPRAMTIDGKLIYRLRTPAFQHQKVLTVEANDIKVPLITK